MNKIPTLRSGLALLALAAALAAPAAAQEAVDIGSAIPEAKAIKEGLFPEDACKELEQSGFKCMGFKPAVKYSLPASSFALGSAEIPETLRRQLDVFAEVLKGKRGTGRQIKVVGHADASGEPEANLVLSLKRANAVKSYLVQKGADPDMLVAVGQGAKKPKNAQDPYAAENRRVEIGRELH
jgi:outer membrane protein OmpA-like peptidoglycan-associated protein